MPKNEVVSVLLCKNINIFWYNNSFYKKENIFLCKKFYNMLQRIQTVYLILTLIVIGVLPFFIPLWNTDNGITFYFMQDIKYTIGFGLCSTLALVSIFSYNNRQNQFVMNRMNIILNLILLGLFLYHLLNLSGETQKVSEKGIGIFLPIVAIVLLVLANKSIKKDEDLVKSVDRIR